ncbi:MAG: 4Fe-4S dicluster domain-containing protein [Deltaproteobacteria bacterium]|nr:4Fe-4S dicluster domain-containing protein [Deltaproteobacteria bacterium]
MEPAIPLNMNTDRDKGFINSMFSSIQARTSAYCFRCITCTNGCPIVLNYREQAKEKLDLLPHQLMYAVRLGLKDLVLESQMLWLCTECYMCTEYCPQGVHVCDVIYELGRTAEIMDWEREDLELPELSGAGDAELQELLGQLGLPQLIDKEGS